ncbi:MAG: WD40 repeat domain-containing protein [Roseimicrobium sp.]
MSSLRLYHFAVAFAACASLAHGQFEAPELTLGPVPAPFVITPPNHAPAGLLRWYGDPKSTPSTNVGEIAWTRDGRRMFTKPDGSPPYQVWKPGPTGTTVELEGGINISETMTLSEDGRWLFGLCKLPDTYMPRWELHRADTLEGVWSIDLAPHLMKHAAFSKDGKWLALVHQIIRPAGADQQVFISILDAATGTRVQVLQPRTGWAEFGTYDHPTLSLTFTNDALLLNPCYDEQRRIKRYPIATWKMEFASDEFDSASVDHMQLSNDGRWLVLWDSGGFTTLEYSGGVYVKRFEGSAWTNEDENEKFNSIRLSPDSTTLVLSGCGKHKVIRLADRKVLHDGAEACLCGDFSPDGRIFWNKCTPFQSVDTRIWQPLSKQRDQHTGDISHLAFSRDGKILASASSSSMRMWSTDREAPPLNLVAPRKPVRMASFAWSPDGSEILGGDGKDFCKWRVSDANMTTREIKGTVLFQSPPWNYETLRFQDIHFVPESGACLLSQSNSRARLVETRHPSSPSVVKRLQGVPYPEGRIVFSKDGSDYLYMEDHGSNSDLCAVRLADSNLRKQSAGKPGKLAGMLPSGGDLVIVLTTKVAFADPETLQIREKGIQPPGKLFFDRTNAAIALSPDGQWLYCLANEHVVRVGNSKMEKFPVLINLKKDGEFTRLEPHLADMTYAEFSPDSTKLAVGHRGGLISLWDVATLAKGPLPQTAVQGESPPQSPGAPATRINTFTWTPEWPSRSRTTDDGDMRGYAKSGAAYGVESTAEIGRLLVNGSEPTVLEGRSGSHESTLPPNVRAAYTYLMKGDVELRALDGKVRVHRQLRGTSRGDLKWLDTYENLSGEPQTIILSYRHKMGGAFDDLRVMNQRPTLLADGQVATDSALLSAGMITKVGGVRRHVGVCFSSVGAPQSPVVRWMESDRALATEWTFRLEPFEKKAIMHDMVHRRLAEGEGVNVGSQIFLWSAMGDLAVIPRLPMMINFAPITKEDAENFELYPLLFNRDGEVGRKEQEMKSMGVDEEGYKKDSMGFRWCLTDTPASGMGAEFGAQRIFALWMDGQPMTFLDVASTDVPGKAPKRRSQHAKPNSPIKVLRDTQWSESDNVFATHDEVVNTGSSPAKCQFQVLIVAQNYFEQVEDGHGKSLDLTTPQPISTFGGKLALVAPGRTKPAILLSLGDPLASRVAKVHLIANRGLFVTYELELAAGERIPFMHLAAQRPLNVYGSAQEAFDEISLPTPAERAAKADVTSPTNWRSQP